MLFLTTPLPLLVAGINAPVVRPYLGRERSELAETPLPAAILTR